MIASRVGVLVAAALALVLAIVLALDTRTADAPISRALAPDFEPTRLAWSRSGEPEIVLERAGTEWAWSKPVAGIPADASTVDATLAALRGARWHRRAPIAQAGPLRVALHATGKARAVKIGIGQPLAGAGQTWVAIDEQAYLVDDWVARALAPEPLALRETRPLRDVAAAKTIVIDRVMPAKFAVRIEGQKLVRPIELRLHPPHVAGLHAALAQVTILSIPTSIDPTILMTISVDAPELVTLELRSGGDCKDGVALGGTFGPACISWEHYRAIEVAIDTLRQPSLVIVDQAPARVDPVRITLPDGVVLDLAKRPRVGDRDADPAQVAELLALLQGRLEAVELDPATKPLSTMTVVSRAGETIELELLPKQRIRRKGEAIALVIGDGGWKILTRASSALRDPTLWNEDELTIQSITIDTTTYTRGAVVGEWTRRGPGRDDPAAVTDLARALAKPRAFPAPRASSITHTLTFTTQPPSGAPLTRTLQLGARCFAVLDGAPLALGTDLCVALRRFI